MAVCKSKYFLKFQFLIAISFSFCAVLLMSCSAQLSQSTETFVDYHRIGGFVNFDDHLVINKSGDASVTRKNEACEFVLNEGEMSQLVNTFDEAMFSELKGEYLPENQGGDFVEYSISYEGHMVKTKDRAVPDELWPILETLNQIVERCP